MSNKAAWITAPRAHPFEIKEAPMPKAGANEIVIKNHAVAINPVDWKIQEWGIFLKDYPAILGTDVAGEVYEVGEGVTNVKKGDRVIGHAISLLTTKYTYSAFQTYTLCPSLAVSKIPSSLPYTSAAVLPLSISTAAACLFKKETLALPLPTPTTQSNSTGKSVLVWGGSSSVGCSAIQLAVAAGVKVVTVAGKHNLEKVKALGAAEAFDHSSPSVAEDIIAALQNTEFLGVCDCIGTPKAAQTWSKVSLKLGGRYGSVMPEPKGVAEGIEGGPVFAPTVALSDGFIGEAVWVKYLPEALEKGSFKAAPEPTVMEGGLEKVQEACDKLKEGISYGKIVVAL